MFRSPQSIINCSRWLVVPQIQWQSSDPTVKTLPGNLSGITPTHFHFLYKALRERVLFLLYLSSSSSDLQRSKSQDSNLQSFQNFFLRKSLKKNRDKHTHFRKFFFPYILPFNLGPPPWPSFFHFGNFFLSYFHSFKWVDSSIW